MAGAMKPLPGPPQGAGEASAVKPLPNPPRWGREMAGAMKPLPGPPQGAGEASAMVERNVTFNVLIFDPGTGR